MAGGIEERHLDSARWSQQKVTKVVLQGHGQLPTWILNRLREAAAVADTGFTWQTHA